ncbi:nuclease-related domain-containing protein [Bacillus sp. B15-48]|uniref:nuclease-related domain-containing protein n=1 Tax=Bacillus sp. B15-48 TaxID=1548601 RepID=UPI00193F04E8|nr:nuclease-related domain-containing protein [Bacillus sp. B15-48]MBM4761676.1 NERD domain-containing protein [Bacillus sp. B15-48]
MLLKRRSESDELLSLRYLNARMELSREEAFRYFNLEKGYEGEVKFDLLLEGLQGEKLIINDLLLQVNNSYFQIDSVIISQGGIHLIDIKNFEGDCYLESDKLYSVTTGREYKNPLDQLKRSATLFRQLLQSTKEDYLVEASIIFINSEFTLYQAPMDLPVIFPTQINRFMKNLNQAPSKLNDGHKKLAQKLLSLHQPKNPYIILPTYHYDKPKKGVYCKICQCFSVSIKKYHFVCGKCGENEKIRHAILRLIKEYHFLFPERKLTTQTIYEWCNTDLDKRTICRVLNSNFTKVGGSSNTYYI